MLLSRDTHCWYYYKGAWEIHSVLSLLVLLLLDKSCQDYQDGRVQEFESTYVSQLKQFQATMCIDASLRRPIKSQGLSRGELASSHILNCPTGTEIRVVDAIRGQGKLDSAPCSKGHPLPERRELTRPSHRMTTCQPRRVTQTLRAHCDGKLGCNLHSVNWSSSDDAFSTCPYSTLVRVNHTCVPENTYLELICADSYIEVTCDELFGSHQLLLILGATLKSDDGEMMLGGGGAESRQVCPKKSRGNNGGDRNCSAPKWRRGDIQERVARRCNRRASCTLSPTEAIDNGGYRPSNEATCIDKVDLIVRYTCVHSLLWKPESRRLGQLKSLAQHNTVQVDRQPIIDHELIDEHLHRQRAWDENDDGFITSNRRNLPLSSQHDEADRSRAIVKSRHDQTINLTDNQADSKSLNNTTLVTLLPTLLVGLSAILLLTFIIYTRCKATRLDDDRDKTIGSVDDSNHLDTDTFKSTLTSDSSIRFLGSPQLPRHSCRKQICGDEGEIYARSTPNTTTTTTNNIPATVLDWNQSPPVADYQHGLVRQQSRRGCCERDNCRPALTTGLNNNFNTDWSELGEKCCSNFNGNTTTMIMMNNLNITCETSGSSSSSSSNGCVDNSQPHCDWMAPSLVNTHGSYNQTGARSDNTSYNKQTARKDIPPQSGTEQQQNEHLQHWPMSPNCNMTNPTETVNYLSPLFPPPVNNSTDQFSSGNVQCPEALQLPSQRIPVVQYPHDDDDEYGGDRKNRPTLSPRPKRRSSNNQPLFVPVASPKQRRHHQTRSMMQSETSVLEKCQLQESGKSFVVVGDKKKTLRFDDSSYSGFTAPNFDSGAQSKQQATLSGMYRSYLQP